MNGLVAILQAIAATAALTLLPGIASAAQAIEVLSTSGCGCCVGWTRHMEENGFVTDLKNLPMADLMQVKMEAGLKPGQTSCHTGKIEAGHVALVSVADRGGRAFPGDPEEHAVRVVPGVA